MNANSLTNHSPLWNGRDSRKNASRRRDDALQALVLEQWKMCVEAAERVSTRRALTNAFFLALNTTAFSAVGAFWAKTPQGIGLGGLVPPLLALLAVCLVWWALVRSYRQLNEAKFSVVHELETRLPANVFTWEWALIRTRQPRFHGYLRLTVLEQVIPVLFSLLYVIAFLLAVFTQP